MELEGALGDGGGTDLGDHQGGNINIHNFNERAPLLDNVRKFEQTIRRTVREQVFNCKFVTAPKVANAIQNTQANWLE